jgi:hypothetical protein
MTILFLLALLQQPAPHVHTDVDRRGDAVMGFSHEKATHHFRLRATGGDIEITVKEPADAATLTQIRGHLAHIVTMFGDGDFTAPMLIHAKNPPGTATMTRLRKSITYTLEPVDGGARIRIVTGNAEALSAIHQFLRFQITDHRTGDRRTIPRE